jgi:hypothetical protein
MYLSSDSWGKLGDYYSDHSNFARSMKVLQDDQLEHMKHLYMKHLLEGLKMPVLNTKTGEEDYIDLSLVTKIVIDSEYVADMLAIEKVKIDIKLTGNEDTKEVKVTAENKLLGSYTKTLSIQVFEEMLAKAINDTKEQRLELVPEFKEITDSLVREFVNNNRVSSIHYARVGEKYELTNGIGVIRDIKTNQDVGTFESFDYLYDQHNRMVMVAGIIISGRSSDDLLEPDRFEFAFYSIEHGFVYSVISTVLSTFVENTKNQTLRISNFSLVIDDFSDSHKYHNMILHAQQQKETIEGVDENHPLFASKMEAFRSNRLSILEESKQKQKQEKIFNQFADIDF